jgi:hypothetical protein
MKRVSPLTSRMVAVAPSKLASVCVLPATKAPLWMSPSAGLVALVDTQLIVLNGITVALQLAAVVQLSPAGTVAVSVTGRFSTSSRAGRAGLTRMMIDCEPGMDVPVARPALAPVALNTTSSMPVAAPTCSVMP